MGRERQPAKTVGKREETREARAGRRISSMSEIPVHSRPRRLVDWINATGAEQDHSLIDQVVNLAPLIPGPASRKKESS
jgi:hypothetical protein